MYGSVVGAITSLLVFLAFQASGILLVTSLLKQENYATRLVFGSVTGSMMLQWLPVPFAFFFGFGMTSHMIALALALVIAVLSIYKICKEKSFDLKLDSIAPFLLRHSFSVFILALLILFSYLVMRGLTIKDGVVYSSQATYGDMSMHLSFITSIAKQGTFPPHYSILPQAQLSYPFLADSISSSLYLLGAPLKFAYVLPMLFAGAQVFFGFYIFAYNWLKSRSKAALAFLMFFFCGGLGFVYFMRTGGLSSIMNDFYQTPTNLVEENIRWVNVIVDMMLPQRATLFGWTVLIPVMYLLQRAVFDGKQQYFIFAAVLAGLLPMIHTHSFLFIAIYSVMLVIASIIKDCKSIEKITKIGKLVVLLLFLLLGIASSFIFELDAADKNWVLTTGLAVICLVVGLMLALLIPEIKRGHLLKLFKTWGLFLIIVCVLALPQLFIWTFKQSDSFIRGHFNWGNLGENMLIFYLKNIGLTAILAIFAIGFSTSKNFLKMSPAFFAWFIAEFIQFQPNNYDNNKLLYPAFMLICCVTADFTINQIKKLKRSEMRAVTSALLITIISVSAVLTIAREMVARYEIFGQSATELAEYVEELPSDAVFLTSTRHNNEIAALTGRNVVCGSPSYLAFHGLDYLEAEHDVMNFYKDPVANRDVLVRQSVDYIVLSDFERYEYNADEAAIILDYERVFTHGTIDLYKVK